MHSFISAQVLGFELPNGKSLFSNLNFSLSARITGLVGHNGVGKTTLAKILSGEIAPTSGQVLRSGGTRYFSQRELPPNITVEQFLSESETWTPMATNLLHAISPQLPCCVLSGGEWMRVRLVRLSQEPFLILDEPTNDLDQDARKTLFQFFEGFEGNLLLISHDREALSYCEEILELSSRGITKVGGNWNRYEAFKENERSQLEAKLEIAKRARVRAKENRVERILQQERRNRKGRRDAAQGGMPRILIGMRKRAAQITTGRVDRESSARAERAVGRAYEAYQAVKAEPMMYADILGEKLHPDRLIVEAQDFNIRFAKDLFGFDLNFSLRGPVRLALQGANGSGKSTLLRAISGEAFTTKGILRRGSLNTLYCDQRCTLDDSLTIFETIRLVSHLSEAEIRNGLAKFLFQKEDVFQKIGSLSGGERFRARLARGLLSSQKPELLMLDEPTNNLDLVNIQFLENLVRQFCGAVIIVSHDPTFLKKCALTSSLNLPTAR